MAQVEVQREAAEEPTIDAVLAVATQDIIGEGPIWDCSNDRLLWSDNAIGLVHEAKANASGTGWAETRTWDLERPIAAAIPRASEGLVIASGTEILFVDDRGAHTTFASVSADPAEVHLNDAKCDSRGRLWAGTRQNDISTAGREIRPGRAALYRIDPDGTVCTVLEGVTLSNGLDWSPDGRTMYYIDTFTRRVDAFDYDEEAGTVSGRRTVVEIARGEGLPDGMTVDEEGCLWIAVAGSGQVRRYRPDGRLLMRVAVPTPVPASCTFGGRDLDTLFIPTARVELPRAVLHDMTHGFSIEVPEARPGSGAGALYACSPGVRGRTAHRFAG